MLRIRRLYFYLVLYASLSMLLVGVATVLRVLIERLFDIASSGFFGMFVGQAQMQEQTALGTALVLVGLPVWLLHWRVVQGWLGAPGGVDDRRSALRRLYVYGVLFTTALSALIAGRDLIENLLALAIGPTAGSVRPSDVTGPLPFAVVATVFWAYHWRIAAVDRNVAGEEDASATLRRWYLYAMLSIGVVLVMRNLAWLCQQIWQTLLQPATLTSVGQTTLSRALVSSGAGLLVGLVVMVGHRAWSQSILAVPNWHGEDERRSVLRKLYLYAMVLLTVATALTNASEILRFAIASLLGVAPSAVQGTPVVVALGEPLANTLVFGAFWIFYWRSVGLAAASQPEVGQQAGVRRLYFYLVSAIALAFVGVSVASLLRLSTDVILQQSAIDLSAMRG
ncbi:MAG TPA: DUF5671 domain-containing protein, partial [Chloroflexota bacterium]